MRRRVEQRLVYALSRFGAGVERVTVHLSDEKNALGGLDRRCRMRAWLRNRGTVAVETLDGRASFGRAADRLEARIEWALVNGQGETPLPLTPAVPSPTGRAALAGIGRRRAPSPVGRKRRRS